MGGQLVELDDKVWLLLTHYKLTHVHGLRVGAMVGVPTFILGLFDTVCTSSFTQVCSYLLMGRCNCADSYETRSFCNSQECLRKGIAPGSLLTVSCVGGPAFYF